MLNIKEIKTYKVESLSGLSVPEILGLAIMTADGDEDALCQISTISCAYKKNLSLNKREVVLETELGECPCIRMRILSSDDKVRLTVEKIEMVEKNDSYSAVFHDSHVVLVSHDWPLNLLADVLHVEVK